MPHVERQSPRPSRVKRQPFGAPLAPWSDSGEVRGASLLATITRRLGAPIRLDGAMNRVHPARPGLAACPRAHWTPRTGRIAYARMAADLPDPPPDEQADLPSSRSRVLAGWLGPLAIACALAAHLMLSWARGRGVHCPYCDRPPDMQWWVAFFNARFCLLGAAFLGGFIATAAAHRWFLRVCGVVALLASIMVFGKTPL